MDSMARALLKRYLPGNMLLDMKISLEPIEKVFVEEVLAREHALGQGEKETRTLAPNEFQALSMEPHKSNTLPIRRK